MESWKLWRQTEAEKDIKKTFKRKETDAKYKKKVKQGESEEALKHCLDKARQRFIKKHDARKHKAYMCSSLQKPKSLSVDAKSPRLNI